MNTEWKNDVNIEQKTGERLGRVVSISQAPQVTFLFLHTHLLRE